MPICDQAQRNEALNPAQSFIVQAPAGSGKTSLLVERYLLLLSLVEQPEEILAITFTRKATAEMRERIVSALNEEAEASRSPTNGKRLSSAQNALKNDVLKDWNLLHNPRRLRIQTIDALCFDLVRHMPWSSRFGGVPTLIENVAPLYLTAAKNTLDHIEQASDWAQDCLHVLQLVDMRFSRAQALIAAMLAKRDRWMRGLPEGSREQFEGMWQSVITSVLQHADSLLSAALKQEITAIANQAIVELAATQADHPLRRCEHLLDHFPAPDTSALPVWQALVALLLTQTGTVRATVNKHHGFPPSNQVLKRRMLGVLSRLRGKGNVIDSLVIIGKLPSGHFDDQQWRTLASLFRLLPLAVAELRLLFKENNQADYIELAQRAEMALGATDSPSDLAMSLDYQIKHILVDEFQDTSLAQIELLSKLTEGWVPGDGRTLFLVGDPMQSIYRFREADVGHFLEIQQQGFELIKPVPLTLSSNFRSGARLVNWFNTAFAAIFPSHNDVVNSAVRYSPAVPASGQSTAGDVVLHSLFNSSTEQSSSAICHLIRSELQDNPDQTIAVLGRSRSHLLHIGPALRAAGIPFQSVDTETMHSQPAVQDLIALTRIVIQPADRVAWLSVLRAPWCGLTLADLSLIAGLDHSQPLPPLIRQPAMTAQLSTEAKARLSTLCQALDAALSTRGRVPIRQSVEAAWLSLGAPALIPAEYLADCALFFELLDQLESTFDFISAETLSEAVQPLWSKTTIEAPVQLLTIHKAKGLEFDTVIIPALEKVPRRPEHELLRWTRLPKQILIALLPASGQEDRFYRFLGEVEQLRLRNELCRLLYVACTRARHKLHLFATLKRSGDTVTPPASSSLLHLIWPVWQSDSSEQTPYCPDTVDPPTPDQVEPVLRPRQLGRVPPGFQTRTLPDDVLIRQPTVTSDDRMIEFSWAGETARIVGITVHRLLQQIDAIGWEQWKQGDKNALISQARGLLMENGIPPSELPHAMTQIDTVLQQIRIDPKAEWIFSSRHHHIRSEWALSGIIDDQIRNIVIDRTFIDADGVRWIIDFKTSRHEGPDIDAFIAREKQRYRQQLEQYAGIVRHRETNEIRLALYFPLYRKWVEWSYMMAV